MQAATTSVFDGKHEELDPSTDEAFLVFSSLAERCTRHPREVVETFILRTENKAKPQVRQQGTGKYLLEGNPWGDQVFSTSRSRKQHGQL